LAFVAFTASSSLDATNVGVALGPAPAWLTRLGQRHIAE
jgi:hypothetical protein